MTSILVDSDVFIDHLRGARRFRRRGMDVCYSVVTLAELCAGRDGEPVVARLLRPFRALPVTPVVAVRAGRLRRRHGVALADALIAATAVEHRLAIATRNVRHFARIPGLRVEPPA